MRPPELPSQSQKGLRQRVVPPWGSLEADCEAELGCKMPTRDQPQRKKEVKEDQERMLPQE